MSTEDTDGLPDVSSSVGLVEEAEEEDCEDRLRSDDVVNCICQINEENGLMIQVWCQCSSALVLEFVSRLSSGLENYRLHAWLNCHHLLLGLQ